MRKLNLVQLIFFPLIILIGNIFLSNWLRDLIIIEWDITQIQASILGFFIVAFMAIINLYAIYCIIKIYFLLTKYVSTDDLEKELRRIKSDN